MKKGIKAHLVVIDPQNDFMDILAKPGDPVGMSLPNGVQFRSTLPVPGALADMGRVATMLQRIGPKLEDIHVTLDSHQPIQIFHPPFWRDQNNQPPNPLTLITHDDVGKIWWPRNPAFLNEALKYTEDLAKGGKYTLMIWPIHCLIGEWGHNVVDVLKPHLNNWAAKEFASIDYIAKGTNVCREHYGALEAEVADPHDPATLLNSGFITTLQMADIVGIAGEASSHCVLATIQQIVKNIGDKHLSKIHILTDGMSPVPQPAPGAPDFPAIASKFLTDMQSHGLVLTKTTDWLS